jgi:hypothetical protein
LDELKLKNIQAMADSERLLKEGFLKEINETIEILNAFENRICKENGIPTKAHKENETLVSIARSLTINLSVIIAEMKSKATESGYNALKKELDKITIERDCLLKDGNKTTLSSELESKPDTSENISTDPSPQSFVKSIITTLKTAPVIDLLEEDPKINAKIITPLIDDQVLKLASECHLFRLNDLIDLCSIKLDVVDTEIKKAIDALSSAGYLSVERSTIKPTGNGITYPALFRLTSKGLEKANTEIVSEIDRWTLLAPGLRYNDMPLMVYAVDNYLPRHNYSFVGFFQKTTIDIPDNPQGDFYPHIHLKDEAQKDVYVMFGHETMSDQVLKSNFSAYQRLSGEQQYCLCVNGRIARIFTSKLEFQNKHYFSPKIMLNITNVGDWPKYDHMLKSGLPDTPQSIWFTSILNGK